MSRDLLDLVRELNTLNDDNLADRVIENSDVQWCLSELQDILEEMPTLTPPNEWVSVEDRLPEVGQEVLVYWRNTSQKAEHFELTHYDGDHWFLLDNTERPWIVVVAWMPLPAPPDRRPPEGEEDT